MEALRGTTVGNEIRYWFSNRVWASSFAEIVAQGNTATIASIEDHDHDCFAVVVQELQIPTRTGIQDDPLFS